MSNNIDELFKKALQDRSSEPPSYLWGRINRQLQKQERRLAGWWWRGIAAAALIAALTGVLQLRKTLSVSEYTTVAGKLLPTASVPVPPAQATQVFPLTLTPRIKPTAPAEDLAKTRPALPPSSRETLPVLMAARWEGVQHTAPSLKVNKTQREIIPLTSKEALQNNLKYQALLQESRSSVAKEKKQVKVALSGHFVPAYSSGTYSSSVKDTRGHKYSGNQLEGMMNTGGGLRLSVATGKRLSLQTGIFYSRMGQQTDQNTKIQSKSAAFSLPGGKKEKVTTTPLGNIKTRTRSVAYSSQEAIVLNSMASKDQTLEQIFGTLEIPLQIRYSFNDNKLKFSLSGGFSGNFIVDNKVYLKSEDEKELLGSTEDIRNFNLSTDWGLGMEYPLGRMVKIMIEPGFRYYLQSLSRNDQIDYKPYMFTLSTGIGIEF